MVSPTAHQSKSPARSGSAENVIGMAKGPRPTDANRSDGATPEQGQSARRRSDHIRRRRRASPPLTKASMGVEESRAWLERGDDAEHALRILFRGGDEDPFGTLVDWIQVVRPDLRVRGITPRGQSYNGGGKLLTDSGPILLCGLFIPLL